MRGAVKVVLVMMALLASEAWGHGVGYRQSKVPAVALEFLYSTGEMMSYREARVFSPLDDRIANQSGRTDAAGRFAFVPETTGKWRVIVRDEEGHQATAEIDITPEFLSGENGKNAELRMSSGAPSDIFVRAVLGVSVLFNVSALVLLLYQRRRKCT